MLWNLTTFMSTPIGDPAIVVRAVHEDEENTKRWLQTTLNTLYPNLHCACRQTDASNLMILPTFTGVFSEVGTDPVLKISTLASTVCALLDIPTC